MVTAGLLALWVGLVELRLWILARQLDKTRRRVFAALDGHLEDEHDMVIHGRGHDVCDAQDHETREDYEACPICFPRKK